MSSSEVFRRPTGRDARRTEPLPIAKIGLTPRQTRAAENIGHSTLYERLGRGEYDAIKDGKRTLITLESIERRRKAVLTKATFKPPKPRALQRTLEQSSEKSKAAVAVRPTEASASKPPKRPRGHPRKTPAQQESRILKAGCFGSVGGFSKAKANPSF